MSTLRADAPLAPPPARAWLVALTLAALLQVGSFAWFFPGNDLTRDLLMVLAIGDGDWPLRGPGINDAVHLGPVWFWLLALPRALGGGLTATVLFVAALATLKVPLAWRLGDRLGGPWLALLFGALMLAPGWGVLFATQLTHTVLLEALLLAAWLPLLTLWRDGDGRAWIVFGAFAGLAVHAHPVAALLWLPAAATAWRRRRRWRGDVGAVAAGLALALLPLLPMLWVELREGWPMLQRIDAAGAKASGFTRATPLELATALTAGSVRVLHAWLPAAWAWAATAALAGVVVPAMLALHRLRDDRGLRRRMAIVLALFVAALLWLVAVRSRTPFYMALLAWPLLLATLALPLGSWAQATRRGRFAASVAAACALAGGGAAALGAIANSRDGHAELPLALIVDVRHFDAPRVRLALAPIHALDAMAGAHCGSAALHVHGELAALVDFYQAIPFRWHCPALPLQAMGRGDGRHWAGATPHLLRLLGHADTGWAAASALAPRRLIAPAAGVAPVLAYRYPARDVVAGAPRTFRVAFDAAADEAVSAYSPLFPYIGATTPVATCDGVAVAPASWTNAGALFLPPHAGHGCRWEIAVESRVADQLDLVTLPIAAGAR